MGSDLFLGFSCPNLLFVFLNLVTYFFASVGTFSGSLFFIFSVPYFGLACDHGNSFL